MIRLALGDGRPSMRGGARLATLLAVTALLPWIAVATAHASEPMPTFFTINGVGGVPGTNYSFIRTREPVNLEGLALRILLSPQPGCDYTPTLPVGQVYTLIATTGGLSGTFEGIPDGAETPQEAVRWGSYRCGGEELPRFRINYHETGSLQTVTATVSKGSPTPVSELRMSSDPPDPTRNGPVTLRAVVETSSGIPSGKIAFGTPAEGCESQPVLPQRTIFVATCHTIVKLTGWTEGPECLSWTMAFTPTEEADMAPSMASYCPLLGRELTRTTLTGSRSTGADGSIAYTATVTPLFYGSAVPPGRVVFRAGGGEPIPGCEEQQLTQRTFSATASCDAPNSVPPSDVVAEYVGAESFASSSSPPASLVMPRCRQRGISLVGARCLHR